jgi:diguanylate cyclase (GGDEF)-like protein
MTLRRATPAAGATGLDHASLGDPRAQRRLRRAVGYLAAIAVPLGIANVGLGAWLGDRQVVAAAGIVLAYGLWMVYEHRTSRYRPAASLAIRTALVTNLGIVGVVTAEPGAGIAATMAAVIPPVVALVYVSRRTVFRLMLLGAGTGLYAAVAAALLPWGSMLPPPIDIIVPAVGVVVGYAAFQIFLWNASSQMTETATELSAAMDLTREVAQTLDPVLVGRIIARHIARAAEVADCTLSMWDRAGDQVVTFAYHPSDMEGIKSAYDLAEFPATRRVLMSGDPCFVDVADPSCDPNEIAYLRSVGQASMVILPLVVRGESIGILELTSNESQVFSDRNVALAQLLAREAAVSLENARLYDEIHDQAFRDALTGLANRRLFLERLTGVLERRRGSGSHTGVLFMDLDNFKLLNDRFGHPTGDEVLKAVGERLRQTIRPGDTAARLGGDEFALLLEEVEGPEEAVAVARRLLDAVARPLVVGDGQMRTGTSIGVALSDAVGDSADDLLRNADIAMYAAKSAGRGRVELFQPEHLERVAARSDIDARLRGAVDRGELRLEYQPIVELTNRTGRIVGVEALVRWEPAGRPVQMPADFITLAEESGEIMGIGRWVLHEACRQVSIWQHAHELPDLRCNVNLSARQFADPGLTGMVATALRDSGLPPACLTLEITETTLMAQTKDTIERVRDLRSMGVRVSIDDFGTGYSSLGYLQTFELDELKIDRSFVSPAGSGPPRVISRAIAGIGRALGLELVAEGIESEAQARWFDSIGCQYAQGFHYSPPLAPAEASAYIDAHRMGSGGTAGILKLEDRRRRRPTVAS